MISGIVYFLTGILAGSFHAVTGPDHLSAVMPLTLDNNQKSWKTGLHWSIGHSAGVIVIAVIALNLQSVLPLGSISHLADRVVGAVLVTIGLWGLRRALGNHIHNHEHEHEGFEHSHYHIHGLKSKKENRKAHIHKHTAFAIGSLQGIAGTSHLYGILPVLVIPYASSAIFYIVGFSIGTGLSMVVFTTAIGYIKQAPSVSIFNLERNLQMIFSAVAVIVGVFWLSNSL